MTKNFKKLIALLLSTALLTSLLPSTAGAVSTEQTTPEQTMISILDDFYTKSLQAQMRGSSTTYSVPGYINKLRQEAVIALQDAGFEAYDVTGSTFNQVEQILCTDLHEIGLCEDYSYIIVLSGETPSNASARDAYGATPGTPFDYTYNGTTYSLRYMTVMASHVPAYGMASTVNLLESKSQTIINNCLNTSITLYLDAVASPLGTVASLLGLDISDFAPAQTATLNLNAATNWTRVFTQVQDYDGSWVYGSCVEFARYTYYLSGHYYDAATNAYKSVPANEGGSVKYSDRYHDHTWRKVKAIESLYGLQSYNSTGPIKYYYGGVVKITHNLNYY